MKLTKATTDQAILAELGERIAQSRLDGNLPQAGLAQKAGVSKRTVERLESGAVATQLSGFIRVCRVLGLLERLDTFIPEPAPSPIAQLKMHGKKRQRASAARKSKPSSQKWTWGDKS